MAKKLSTAALAAKKRPLLIGRTAHALGVDESEAARLLQTGRRQGVRLNPLRGNTAETLAAMRELGWQGEQYAWMPGGYSVESGLEALRDSQLAADGRVLIQNAASWLPVLLLDAQPEERVLDVCAAPGGKTTHIAASTGNRALITANDNSRVRQAKLRAMCGRIGADIDRFTLFDAQALARKLDGEQYDRILLDAPCSGEGLMRLDRDKDFETWSVAQVKRLQQLQRKLLVQAWQLLAPGGTLVYSTCTMAPEEDELVVDYALRRLEDVELAPIIMELPNRVPAVSDGMASRWTAVSKAACAWLRGRTSRRSSSACYGKPFDVIISFM